MKKFKIGHKYQDSFEYMVQIVGTKIHPRLGNMFVLKPLNEQTKSKFSLYEKEDYEDNPANLIGHFSLPIDVMKITDWEEII